MQNCRQLAELDESARRTVVNVWSWVTQHVELSTTTGYALLKVLNCRQLLNLDGPKCGAVVNFGILDGPKCGTVVNFWIWMAQSAELSSTFVIG